MTAVLARGAGLVAMLAVASALLAACSPQRRAGADDAATPSPPATSDAGLPTVVGLRDGAVVEVDPESGEVVAEHAVGAQGELVDLELVRVRGAAVVVRRTDGRTELVEVGLDDGATRLVGRGERPAVTADGSRLAFVRELEDTGRREVVAATWEGTQLGAWPIAESATEDVVVHAIGWSGSGEELAVTIDTGGGPQVLVLPLDRDGTLRGAAERVPPTSVGAVLRAGSFREPHLLTMAEGCCGGEVDRWRVIDVVPHTWSVTELVAGLDGPVQHLDWTSDRHHLLLTLDTTPPRVVRWHPGDRVVDVVDDVVSAEW